MAILIDASVNLQGNISIDKAYLRLEYKVNQYGNKIQCPIFTYSDKTSYDEDKGSTYAQQGINCLLASRIPRELWFNYDKDVDGTDVLQVSHDKTRDYLVDPSQGGFPPSDVSIVDIDSSTA